MIGTDTLLFPETGHDFLCCLKTAVMFSERVYCLSAASKQMVSSFQMTETNLVAK
jgi:hypothetical protein